MIQIASRRMHRVISAVVMASLLLIPAIALAQESPVRVDLSYQPPLSNAGPEDSTGVIEIDFEDGEIQGEFEGLGPESDARYEVWLYNSETEDALSLTTFEADPSGATRIEASVDGSISRDGWNMVVITIEDSPDPSPEPDDRWSIVGAIPGSQIAAELAPADLPRTANRPAPSDSAAAYAALILGGAVAAGFLAVLIGRKEA
ncbi:hypothetical protein BH23CHL2_BH23CHL2_28620 [soil metagenome]